MSLPLNSPIPASPPYQYSTSVLIYIAIKLAIGQQLVLDGVMGGKSLFEGIYNCLRHICHFL